jgi:hypothetical protein
MQIFVLFAEHNFIFSATNNVFIFISKMQPFGSHNLIDRIKSHKNSLLLDLDIPCFDNDEKNSRYLKFSNLDNDKKFSISEIFKF